MALINRVAISNVLNFYGDGLRAPWSPRFRYECLDFRGQSTAVNLTNGGGKTTLAEAMLAVLSRDHTLIKQTRKKFSPKSSQVWSHTQVELIRPLANSGQMDFMTAQGNDINGEHWVFGMYGFRNDDNARYYYYQGRLEDLPIGTDDGKRRTLISNQMFAENLKTIKGVVMRPGKTEWDEALALKANLPQSTIKQMADFQKRGGQDKSALLFDIKSRPGESYAEVFFYKVLAPAIMEGIMDREGEEGEVRLEDTVERAVFSTVKAKQDTEKRQKEADELQDGVKQLTKLMRVASQTEELRELFNKRLSKIQIDVQVLTELVGKGRLPGVPKSSLPDGLKGAVVKHLVIEPGSTEVRVLDRGLALLLGKEAKHANEQAERNSISGRKITQVIDIPCDLFLQEKGVRGNKPKSYSIDDATSLIKSANKVGHGLTNEAAVGLLEDAIDWLEHHGDTNPYRIQLVQAYYDIKRLKLKEKDFDKEVDKLLNQQSMLQSQQTRMETNEGLYNTLVESGLFSDEELKEPMKTAGAVTEALDNARRIMSQFEVLEAQLKEHIEAWESFVLEYGKDSNPSVITEGLKAERLKISTDKEYLGTELNETRSNLKKKHGKQQILQREIDDITHLQARLTEHREAYGQFIERFGDVSPKAKETALRQALSHAESEIVRLEPQQLKYQEGVKALHQYHEEVSESQPPAQWLSDVIQRRSDIAVELSVADTQLKDLRKQRDTLEQESIAANASTRQALDCLVDKAISYSPLHHLIDSLELGEKRKRQVLGVFSALLFAPVIESEEEAQQAAEMLAEIGAQVPVFLHQSIADYCQNAEIASFNEEQLLVGTTSGVITRSVACLLDPELVEREKELLDAQIIETGVRIDALSNEQTSIADETEIVILAHRARKAVEDNEADQLKLVTDTLDQFRDDVEELTKLTADLIMDMIRGAQSYIELGGSEKDQSLQRQMDEFAPELSALSKKINEMELTVDKIVIQVSDLDERMHAVLPVELATMLNAANIFFEKGGPIFITNAEQQRQKLTAAQSDSEERHTYEKYFKGAQTYLDSRSGKQLEGNLEEQLAVVARELKATIVSRKEKRMAYEAINESIPSLERALNAIDNAALRAIDKYRKIAQLSEDIIGDGGLSIEQERLIELCSDLLFEIHEECATDKVKRLADNITGELNEVDIDRKADDLRRSKKELLKTESHFTESAHTVAGVSNGFKPVEKKILEEVKSAKDIANVRSLYEGLLEQFNLIQERLHQCESSEREARQGVTSRLAHLIDYATMDLEILKSVVGSNRGKHSSYFIVESDVLDREGIQKLMDSILSDVEISEKQRRERADKGMSAPDDEGYHEDLRTLIRDKLYKNIFTKPLITYVNDTIRAAGDANEFNESLSEGQKAALSLMWTIRLADFAIEREAKRLSSRRSQQRARDMSENIVLIDGLFSNLSDRDLIDSAMAGIESTRGSFQLIGLIHNPHYQNDSTKFPVFIIGKNEGNGLDGGKKKGWVSFTEDKDDNPDPGALRTAQILHIPKRQ